MVQMYINSGIIHEILYCRYSPQPDKWFSKYHTDLTTQIGPWVKKMFALVCAYAWKAAYKMYLDSQQGQVSGSVLNCGNIALNGVFFAKK